MRKLIANDDLKRVMQGVSAACAAGLLIGAAMQPNLRDDAVRGPQQLVAGGGPRGPMTAAEFAVGAYGANPPDYVLGTDWTRPRPIQTAAYEREPAQQDDDVALTADDDPTPLRVVRAEWREPPPVPRNYPSADGGRVYDGDLPAPPAPPGSDEDPG